jgi:hypothetical protein
MADEKQTLEDVLPVEGLSDFQLDIAGLSDRAAEEARTVVQDAAADGTLGDLDLDEVVSNAEKMDDARERFEDLSVDRAEAIADGDFDKAEEISRNMEYELEEVESVGSDTAIHEAQVDESQTEAATADLDQAAYDADVADEHAQDAIDAAADGDFASASYSADLAADYGSSAIDAVADSGAGDYDSAATADIADTSGADA